MQLSWAELMARAPPRLVAQEALAGGRVQTRLPVGMQALSAAAPHFSPSSSSDTSSDAQTPASSSSEASSSTLSEGEEALVWVRAIGKKGHLHLLKPGHLEGTAVRRPTACGRWLHAPEVGIGLREAASTGADWSPRCRNKLGNRAQECWTQLRSV